MSQMLCKITSNILVNAKDIERCSPLLFSFYLLTCALCVHYIIQHYFCSWQLKWSIVPTFKVKLTTHISSEVAFSHQWKWDHTFHVIIAPVRFACLCLMHLKFTVQQTITSSPHQSHHNALWLYAPPYPDLAFAYTPPPSPHGSSMSLQSQSFFWALLHLQTRVSFSQKLAETKSL